MHPVHGDLDNVRRRSLYRGIHRNALSERTLHKITRGKFRNRTSSSEHRRDIAFFLRLRHQSVQIPLDLRIGLKIALNVLRRLLLRDGEILAESKGADSVDDTEIDRLLSGFDTQLTTITGIDPTLAAVILSEIGGDIRRFSSSAKLAAYAGVDPTVKQSGDFSGTRMKMSKRGSSYLRRAIWLASAVAAFKDSAIHALYERKRAEGIDHMTVIGHKS